MTTTATNATATASWSWMWSCRLGACAACRPFSMSVRIILNGSRWRQRCCCCCRCWRRYRRSQRRRRRCRRLSVSGVRCVPQRERRLASSQEAGNASLDLDYVPNWSDSMLHTIVWCCLIVVVDIAVIVALLCCVFAVHSSRLPWPSTPARPEAHGSTVQRSADQGGRLDRHRVVLAFYRFPLQEDTVSLAHCANSNFASSALSGVANSLKINKMNEYADQW